MVTTDSRQAGGRHAVPMDAPAGAADDVAGPLELVLVMPVYNEQECIADVVRSWRDALARSVTGGFSMLVLDDGSRDGTAKELAVFADDPALEVVHKPNSGHGPTILLGYRRAIDRASWVFQVDSDDEMSATHFSAFWEAREAFDALFGIRQGRAQNLARRIVTLVSRLVVRLPFGGRVADVNVPYRLMRSAVLREALRAVPDDTFAPNVAISGLLGASGARIANIPVPHQGRKTGGVSITNLRLWRAAARSLLQTATIAVRSRGARRNIIRAVARASAPPPP